MRSPRDVAPQARVVARPRWRWRRRLLVVALALAAMVAAMHEHVVQGARERIFTAATVPCADCIVVPGARIFPDGRPYPLLADRLAAALDLFRRGKAARLVLSGRGSGGVDMDEVGAMRRWLLEHGVPDDAMQDDALGLRTLDTMQHCGREFGARSVIVVTNPFHLARSVFLAQHCGLDVSGVEAPYGTEYSMATMLKNQGREVVARVWAWLDVFVFGVG